MKTQVEPFICPDCGSPRQESGSFHTCVHSFTEIDDAVGDELMFAHEDDVDLLFATDASDMESSAESFELVEGGDDPIRLQGTFIQTRPLTTDPTIETIVEGQRPVPAVKSPSLTAASRPIISNLLGSLLLALVAGFGGGFAVYYFGPAVGAGSVSNGSQPAAESELLRKDIFVNRNAAPQAANTGDLSAVPVDPTAISEQHIPAGTQPVRLYPSQKASEDVPPETAIAETSPPENVEVATENNASEKVANVAGMAVERSTSRRPTARCADGTYSYAASRSAACIGRGGIAEAVEPGKPVSQTPQQNVAYILGPRGGCYYLDSSKRKVYVQKKFCL